MKSDAKTVDDYLTQIPHKRVAALTKLRKLCLDHLPGYEESMAYRQYCC